MDRPLPHNLEYERSLISGMLRDQETIDVALKSLTPEDFYSSHHKAIVQAISNLNLKGAPCDLNTVSDELREIGSLKKIGGAVQLAKIFDEPVPSSTDYYSKKIIEDSIKRRVVDVGNKIAQRAWVNGHSPEEIEAFAYGALSKAFSGGSGNVDLPRRGFDLLSFDATPFVLPDFIIRGYIEADTLVVGFGDPGSYKTMVFIDMGACVAIGKPFHGQEVKQGSVAYIGGEGMNNLRRRFRAYEIENGVSLKGAPLFISNGAIGLCDDGSIDLLIQRLGKIAEKCGDPVLVIKGAVDAEFKCSVDAEKTITLEAKKMKDAAYPEPMSFKPHVVGLGVLDGYGDEVTSVALQRIDYEPPKKNSTTAGIGRKQQRALKVLSEIHETHRKNVENGGGDPGRARVEIDDWKRGCENVGIDGKSFYDVRTRLTKRGLVRIEGIFAFLAN
jgi:hypothetical protein